MNFNSNLYYLGGLCKRGHEYQKTGKSLRYKIGSSTCVVCQREYIREWNKKYPERAKELVREWEKRNPKKVKERGKKERQKLKLEVFEHYGGVPPKCGCCGEAHIEFLSIDHIAGGGEKHRRSIKKRAGINFYRWLRKNNFPKGYRVLCHNCNCALGFFGYCPHKKRN